MKVLAVTTAFAGLTAVSALPFWHTHQDPPELTVAEWQAIQTGDFNALPVHAAHHQPAASLWDRIKSVVSSPFGVPDSSRLVEAIGSYVDSYVDDNVNYFDDDSEKTIWQLLQEDEEHYSKIVKLLKMEETGKAIKVLDNRDLSITFFAPGWSCRRAFSFFPFPLRWLNEGLLHTATQRTLVFRTLIITMTTTTTMMTRIAPMRRTMSLCSNR
jgi:hypothetical protein